MTNPTNALDCTPTAGQPDLDCGAGFIMADRAVVKAAPTVARTLSPASPNGLNGWYTTPVAVTWQVSDLGAPATAKTGCDASTVSAEGTVSLSCSATNLYGTGSGSVTFKLDRTAPTGIVFHGMQKKYKNGKKPKKNKISCTATDAISGVTSCVISGFSKKKGKHTLTATATNGAGLTSTATFKYKIL